jgi:hypothetical protein
MHIIFGCELDTGCFPDALKNQTAGSGTAVLGPAGLTGLLETRLEGRVGSHLDQWLNCFQPLLQFLLLCKPGANLTIYCQYIDH